MDDNEAIEIVGVLTPGLIEENNCESLEVDFANKYIGGGDIVEATYRFKKCVGTRMPNSPSIETGWDAAEFILSRVRGVRPAG
ncbi:hypothetical protein MKX03_034270 [Papaver bracteatum]|nr:hypothetical protein MKX03_034270 [Papaver bracteatum]